MSFTNDMTDKEVFENLLPVIKNVYKSFEYLGISFEDYCDIVLDEISKNDKYDDFKTKLKDRMNLEVERLLNDSEKSLLVISSYIDSKISKVDSYDDIIKAFKKIDSFFSKYYFFVGQDLFTYLYSENEKFRLMIEKVYEKKKEDILLGKVEDIFDSDFLIFTVKTYCDLNNLSVIKKEKSENIESEFLKDSKNLDIVRLYINELTAPILSAEEEKELLIKIKSGDMQARDKLIESNLRLVISVAKKFQGRGMAFLDLIQEGNIGLMNSIDKFDIDRGVRFSTYAVYQIKVSVSRAIFNQGRNIRIPVSKQEEIQTYVSKISELEKKYGRSLSTEEISKILGKKISEISQLEALRKDTISINLFVGENHDAELGDFISNSLSLEDEIINDSLPEQVRKLLKNVKLTEQQLDILLSRYGICRDHIWTLDELSKKYGVSKAWIGQVEMKCIERLRNSKNIESFSIYMDNPDEAVERLKKFKIKPKKTKVKTGKRGVVLKSIYQYFGDFSRKEIDFVLDNLNDADKRLVFLRYGNDLDNPSTNSSFFGEEECNKFYGALIPKIRKRLNNLRLVNDDEEIMVIKDTFFNTSPVKVLEREDYQKMLSLLKRDDIVEVMDGLNTDEKIILSLRLGFVDGKHFTIKAISEFLGIPGCSVVSISHDALLRHNDKVSGILNKSLELSTNIAENNVLIKKSEI